MRKKIIIVAIVGIVFLALFYYFSYNPSQKKEIQINSGNNNISEENAAPNIEGENKTQEEALLAEENPMDITQDENKPVEENIPDDNSANKEIDKTESNSAVISGAPNIQNNLVNWGFAKSSGRKIDTIIIHSTYNALGGDEHNLDKILDIYKSYGVAPHYIITREGKIYRLVKDENIAYHAGVSKVPDGRTNVNDFSIGIEIIETKSESPSSTQYSLLKKLIAYLKNEYKIKYMLEHSDIAPGRKDDPWNFNWEKVE